MKLNILMSYFQSKSYNCTAAQLLNPFRTHFKEFQFLTCKNAFSAWKEFFTETF